LIVTSHCFGKNIEKKIDKLLTVTRRIEEQDLDFQIESCGIYEVDRALDALEHMKNELKKSLDRQWQADKMQCDQISALAHDIKTPLTIIRGNSELLSETSLSEEQRECVKYVEDSVKQIQNYITSLIDISKIKNNYMVNRQSVAIDKLLQTIKVQTEGLCIVKKLKLEWQENYLKKQTILDGEQFVRAIMNVISNAVEYAPEKSSILFQAFEVEDNLIITVCDQGSGFSPEVLKHGTEQFYMDEESRTSGSHYGIGLYFTNLVVNQHGGNLLLENLSASGGAKVTMKFNI
jgi:K+-sensing histidine kinase KdpD